ncbi:MAG: hypothetical protein AAF721_13165 [Myxococcota bacterium]
MTTTWTLRSTLLATFALAGACAGGEIPGAMTFGPAVSAGDDGGQGQDDDAQPDDGDGGPDGGGPADGPADGPGDDAGEPDDGAPDAAKGDCCSGNGSPGCDDPAIEACVCAQDDFCCVNVWDDLCSTMVVDLGCAPCAPPADDGGMGDPSGGDSGGDMGATDAGVVDTGGGGGDTAGECPVGFGDCCAANNSIGCDDCEIETCVCDLDSYCCDTDWDDICVGHAVDSCGACGGDGATGGAATTGPPPPPETTGEPGAGDCCDPDNGTPGCDDLDVESCVCLLDSYCCDTEWDDICVGEATSDCDACGGGATTDAPGTTGAESTGSSPDGDVGNCCAEHGATGCSIPEIEACVCAADAFCCDIDWDDQCVDGVDACPGVACPP